MSQDNPKVRAEVIAKHYDVHPQTILNWAGQGTIPCVRIGKSVRFDFDAVVAAVNAMQESQPMQPATR